MGVATKIDDFYRGRRVVVAGGAGFLGSHLCARLARHDCEVLVPRSAEYDLTHEANVERMYADMRPDTVIHLAARVGGIGANSRNPGAYFFDNLMMGALLLEHARRVGIDKFMQLGTVCSYPKFTPVPFREEELWNGYPEETNAPYGIAKKALLVQSQAYRKQYGTNSICLMSVNLYGPRDNFDLEDSHVIPALIRKMVDAKQNATDVVLWGDGSVSREFLFVEDCARALELATALYNDPDPVNVGAGFEIKIRDLAALVARTVGFEGEIKWDTSKPNGQPRRCLDTSRARERFGFEAEIPFEDGLRRTVDWFTNERAGDAAVSG